MNWRRRVVSSLLFRRGRGMPLTSAKLERLASSGKAPSGPVGILWDMENCPIPSDVRPDAVATNIRMALKAHPLIDGCITTFSAYGDFHKLANSQRGGCQRTGINLMDVPNGPKDASDKAILVDMFLFALDNPPPSTIFLISGDVDFAPALHKLGQRGYSVWLAAKASCGIASSLFSACKDVWSWQSLARGEGCVPIRQVQGPSSSDPSQLLEEDPCLDCGYEGGKTAVVDDKWENRKDCASFITNVEGGPAMQAAGKRAAVRKAAVKRILVDDESLKELQMQLLNVLKINGGELHLARLPVEYQKEYGTKLCPRRYGPKKLRDLLDGMEKTLKVTCTDRTKFVVHLVRAPSIGAKLDTNEDFQLQGGFEANEANEEVDKMLEEVVLPILHAL